MELAEQLNWVGYTVHAPEAIWVCVTSWTRRVPSTADGIDYYLEFEAQPKLTDDAPDKRTLQLRTSGFLVATELRFISLVIDGQMLQTEKWDPFKEVYEKD